MRTWVARGSSALFVTAWVVCGGGGGGDGMGSDEPSKCTGGSNVAAMARPPGVAAGEPYCWLRRSWRSPLGLTVRTY
jgi:hypothetical protein